MSDLSLLRYSENSSLAGFRPRRNMAARLQTVAYVDSIRPANSRVRL